MKYTIAFVVAALIMSAALLSCRGGKKNSTPQSYEAIQRVGLESVVDLDLLTAKKWKLVRIKDSYDDIWKDVETEASVISFNAEGGYAEDKPGNPTHKGTFSLQGEKGMEIVHSGNEATLEYRVDFLEKEKLVLAIQGRHGDVFHVYEAIK